MGFGYSKTAQTFEVVAGPAPDGQSKTLAVGHYRTLPLVSGVAPRRLPAATLLPAHRQSTARK